MGDADKSKPARKLLSFAEAIIELEAGHAIHRYGHIHPYYKMEYDGLRLYFDGGSRGECMKRNVRFPVEDTKAADWVVLPREKFEEWQERQRQFYAEQMRQTGKTIAPEMAHREHVVPHMPWIAATWQRLFG